MSGQARLTSSFSTAVVGGGIAGVAAAVVLAERGGQVTLFEKEPFLGGRAGAWSDELVDGTRFQMERGFHAFFRQYYNLRELLKRIDPELSMLEPVSDYPICGPLGTESFANLSTSVPLNLAQLVYRTETIGWRDLLRVNARAALAMLAFDQDEVYRRYDHLSAGDYLDSLRFPPRARRMLFDVFAHSFFNPETEMSAAELLMMFHFYFTGNPEGLLFDVARQPFSTALWQPMAGYLESIGVRVATNSPIAEITRAGRGYWVGEELFDSCVLALSVEPLKQVVECSSGLEASGFQAQVGSLKLTRPFVVWRLWLDRMADGDRSPFAGTTGVGILDNISVYEQFEDESAQWTAAHKGSVIELHAYSVPPDMSEAAIRAELIEGLEMLYPELAGAGVVDERFLYRRDCPAFEPGSAASRPSVSTAYPTLKLAGDFVKLPVPSALMERATTSGFMAANQLLALHGVQSEPIWSVPTRGVVPAIFLGRKRTSQAPQAPSQASNSKHAR